MFGMRTKKSARKILRTSDRFVVVAKCKRITLCTYFRSLSASRGAAEADQAIRGRYPQLCILPSLLVLGGKILIDPSWRRDLSRVYVRVIVSYLSKMRAHFWSRIARAAGKNSSSSSSVTTGRVSEIFEVSGGSVISAFCGGFGLGRAVRVDSATRQLLSARRGFASVAAIDEEDDRPPSLRKSSAKKEDLVLRAFVRQSSGKIHAKKERRLGLVPSIVFEQEKIWENNLISCERKQLDDILNRLGRSFFLSRAYELEVYDKPGPGGQLLSRERVIPRTIHHSAVDELMNVTFMKAPADSKVKVVIPIVFLGEDSCPGIRRGGYVNTITRKVPYLCPVDAIPPFLEVDISTLDVGDKVLLKDLKVDPRLKLLRKDSLLPVIKIMGTRTVEAAASPK
ncbi:unnamed protein product [Calypogeia fissa]